MLKRHIMCNYWRKIEKRGSYKLDLKTITLMIKCMIPTKSPRGVNVEVQTFSLVHVCESKLVPLKIYFLFPLFMGL
jgi:hypothetical protein